MFIVYFISVMETGIRILDYVDFGSKIFGYG